MFSMYQQVFRVWPIVNSYSLAPLLWHTCDQFSIVLKVRACHVTRTSKVVDVEVNRRASLGTPVLVGYKDRGLEKE